MKNEELILIIVIIAIIVILFFVFRSNHDVHHNSYDHVHINGTDGPSQAQFQALVNLVDQQTDEIADLTMRLDNDTRGETVTCEWNGDPVSGTGTSYVIMDITSDVPSWIDPNPLNPGPGGILDSFQITEAGVYNVGFSYLINETNIAAPPNADVGGSVLLFGTGYISGALNIDMNDQDQNRSWSAQTTVSGNCVIPEEALPVAVNFGINSSEGVELTVVDDLNNRGWVTKLY